MPVHYAGSRLYRSVPFKHLVKKAGSTPERAAMRGLARVFGSARLYRRAQRLGRLVQRPARHLPGPLAAKLAGRVGDGLIGTAPDAATLEAFDDAGGSGKPRYAQLTVCWAERLEDARRTAFECWPNAALEGPLGQELPLPSHFEAAVGMVTEDSVAKAVVCGPDPEPYATAIDEYVDAGYTHVYLHQVGTDQDGFFGFCESELLPHYQRVAA